MSGHDGSETGIKMSVLTMCEIIVDTPMEASGIWKSPVWNLRENTMKMI